MSSKYTAYKCDINQPMTKLEEILRDKVLSNIEIAEKMLEAIVVLADKIQEEQTYLHAKLAVGFMITTDELDNINAMNKHLMLKRDEYDKFCETHIPSLPEGYDTETNPSSNVKTVHLNLL